MPNFSRQALALIGLLLLVGCASQETPTSSTPSPRYTPARFADLPNWATDDLSAARPALTQNCAALTRRSESAWADFCAALTKLPAGNNAALRTLLEKSLTPYLVSDGEEATGLFTGYYEPILAARRERTGDFTIPIHGRPRDLVSVELGQFKPEWQGQRLWGQLEERENGPRLVPYPDRASIVAQSPLPTAPVLGYTNDRVGLFVLQIQGSGILQWGDNTQQRINYAAQNGQAYVALGKVLREVGLLTPPITMPAIRAYLATLSPSEQQAWLNRNPSYIFFATNAGTAPLGSLNVPLTPRRSLAVDKRFIPLGSPLWVDVPHPIAGQPPLQQLMAAQDTGGAIKGVVRGDVFWGAGDDAAEAAGLMQSRGRYWLLWPNGAPLPAAQPPAQP